MKLPRIAPTLPNLLNAIGIVTAVYLLVVLAQTVKRNYDLGREITQLRAETQLLESQKRELANSIQYYGTDSYRERQARANLGLQLPGENVVIIPTPTPVPAPDPNAAKAKQHAPSHFTQWLNFLLGRPIE